MSVVIRLSRKGKTADPTYRIVVMEKRSKRDGKTIDILGTYDPLMDPPRITLDNQKLERWIKNGAKPSRSVEKIVNYKHAQILPSPLK